MILEEGLVSIVSPCYNGEKYISKMLDSVLFQTWESIELICIDDGSTDRTAEIIQNYIPLFERKQKKLILLKQENMGQAAALNHGLKYVTGEFMAWMDCDDYIFSDSIEKRIALLKKHQECSIATSNFYEVYNDEECGYLCAGGDLYGNLNYQPEQFELLLAGKSIIHNLTHLIRFNDFIKINPNREINIGREGQNYQMLLPMLYYYKRCYTSEVLAAYVIRKNSHSHTERSFEQLIERNNGLIKIVYETLLNSNIPNSSEIIKRLNIKKRTF